MAEGVGGQVETPMDFSVFLLFGSGLAAQSCRGRREACVGGWILSSNGVHTCPCTQRATPHHTNPQL